MVKVGEGATAIAAVKLPILVIQIKDLAKKSTFQ